MHTANLHDSVTAHEQDGCLVVRVDGAITAMRVEEARFGILAAWENHPAPTPLILDLGGVPQIDSSGIGLLMELANRTAKANVPLALCCLQDKPARLLNKTQINGRFHIYPSVAEATLAAPSQASAVYRPDSKVSTEAARVSLSASRKRSRGDEDVPPRRSHRFLWALTVLMLMLLIAAGAYGYLAVAAYRGQMNLLPAIQDNLVAAGRRIDATENALRSWVVERDHWRQRLGQAETKINDTTLSLHQEAQESAAGRQQLQAELDRNTAGLQAQLDTMQTAQEQASNRIDSIEEQIRRLQAGDTDDGRMDDSIGAPDSQHRNFALPISTPRELAPGVWIDVSKTDVARRQFDGRVWLMPGHQAISIRGGELGKPILLRHGSSGETRELVVTNVGSKAIAGYLASPRQATSVAAISSSAR